MIKIFLLIFSILLFGASNNQISLRNNAPHTLKASIYDGNDLYFDDLTVFYDGKPHSIIASCPIEWTFTYDKSNTYTEIGVYEVSATFVDSTNYYENVIKTATLTILEEEKDETKLPIILGTSFGSLGLILVSVAIYFGVREYKKKKYTKPL